MLFWVVILYPIFFVQQNLKTFNFRL